MSRRTFLESLTALVGGFAVPAVACAATSWANTKTMQRSPLAEFQYHLDRMLYSLLAVRPEPVEGQLVREPDNRYDNRAVRVEWQGRKLGYIPRLDNAEVSQLLDKGGKLEAVIARLAESCNPWERVGVEVRWMM